MKQNGESKNARNRIPKAALKILLFMPDIRVFWGFTVSIGIVDGRVGVQGGGKSLARKSTSRFKEI